MDLQMTTVEKSERRGTERYPFLKTIFYACSPDSSDFKGVTIDISKYGLSMYIFSTTCIQEGLQISIKDPLPVASQKGTVRWVKEVERDLYRTGLQLH